MDHLKGLLLVFPSLVGVHGERQVGDLTDGLDHLLVIVEPDLDFKNIELLGAFLSLLAHHVGGVDSDREGCVRSLGGVEPPDPVPRLAHQLSHKVVQRDVHGSLRGGVALVDPIHISQDVIDLERVAELPQVNLFQEVADALHGLPEVRRHGGLAVAGESVIFNLHLHVRRGGS